MESNRNNVNIILKDKETGELFYVGFDSAKVDKPRELNHPFKRQPDKVRDDDYDYTRVLGSCNGLLCLFNENQTDGKIVLWNMSTGDYKVLPDEPVELPQPRRYVKHGSFCGLGYDSINYDYKLVRIVQEIDYTRGLPLVSEVKVYSLKTNKWKRGEEIPYYFCNLWGTNGTFIDGALHWLGIKERTWESRNRVIAVDVGTEKYRQVELLDSIQDKTYNLNLGALRGCLCTMAICFDDRVKVWIMKEYGVKESWTMLYSFEGCLSSALYLYPLAYSQNDDKLVQEKDGISLLWYDVERKEFKNFKISQLKSVNPFRPEICMESLVKLGDQMVD